MKRILTLFLACILLLSPCAASALTPGERLAVVGADLTDAQLDDVYELFGFRRGSVPELKLTSDEEKALLSGLVDADVIGSKSVSCVCIELSEKGRGLELHTHNVTWCTEEMFLTALSTAGIEDARVTVAAPFASAGTAALAGIYKAWEALSGTVLDKTAKDAGAQELAAAASLSEALGSENALRIIAELKALVGSEPAIDGDALNEKLGALAGELELRLPEDGAETLRGLFETFKKLDPQELREKAEAAAETLRRVQAVKEKADGFFGALRRFFRPVIDFFGRLFGKAKSS